MSTTVAPRNSSRPAITAATIRTGSSQRLTPVLIIVEGIHDARFLKCLSSTLHRESSDVPDLRRLEEQQSVIFVPLGGGQISGWARRFAALGCPEFHLYDRVIEPEIKFREQAVATINSRQRCRGLLLSKRSLDNYLHQIGIHAAGGGIFHVREESDVAAEFARRRFEATDPSRKWLSLPNKARRKLAAQAREWLQTHAVPQMTLELLADRDRKSELLGWLREIGRAIHPA